MIRLHDLPVVLTLDEDGGFVVECPVIPGCISQGDTRDEALANIREAIELCLESQAAEGRELPERVESGCASSAETWPLFRRAALVRKQISPHAP